MTVSRDLQNTDMTVKHSLKPKHNTNPNHHQNQTHDTHTFPVTVQFTFSSCYHAVNADESNVVRKATKSKLQYKDTHLSGCIISSPLLLPLRLLLCPPMKLNNPPPKIWEKISSIPLLPPLPSRRPCSPYLSYNSRFSGFDNTS